VLVDVLLVLDELVLKLSLEIDAFVAVTKKTPGEDPRARRAVTENRFYVIYALTSA
jgi:hypothetical protein